MNSPKVSIIIPTYNRAHLIGETLSSILDQTLQDWECIVVDDGSSDNTKQIIEQISNNDKRVKYFKRPVNRKKGANACRNYGFEQSKGEFIQWFDSDDLMHPKLLEKKLKKLIEHPEYDFCLSKMQAFQIKEGKKEIIRTTKIKHNYLFEDYVAGKISIGTPSILWRRSVLEKQDILFDENLSQSQDLEFHSRIFFKNKNVVLIEKPLILFRLSKDSISGTFLNNDNKVDSFLTVRKNIIELAPDNKKVVRSCIKNILWLMRKKMAAKNYTEAYRCLKLVLEYRHLLSLQDRLKLNRVKFTFFVLKFIRSGDTKLKPMLKI